MIGGLGGLWTNYVFYSLYKNILKYLNKFLYRFEKVTSPPSPPSPLPVIGLKMSAKSGLACGLAGLGTINQFNNPNSV